MSTKVRGALLGSPLTIVSGLTVPGTIEVLTRVNSTSGNDLILNAGSVNRDLYLRVNDVSLVKLVGSTGQLECATPIKITGMASTYTGTGLYLDYVAGSAMAQITTGGDGGNNRSLLLRASNAGTPNANQLVLLYNGKVGIGMTPIELLTVNGNFCFPAGDHYLYNDGTNTATGSLTIQAGAGSASYGGGLNLFANSHATKPGWVIAGISSLGGTVGTANEGRFAVNNHGVGTGTELFTVLRSGNVGIGSTSAPQKLTVVSAVPTHIMVQTTQVGLKNADIQFTDLGGTNVWAVGMDIPQANTADFQIQSIDQGANRLTILKSNGNIGIGTTTPTVGKLQILNSVAGGNAVALAIQNNSTFPVTSTSIDFAPWSGFSTARIAAVYTGPSAAATALTFNTHDGGVFTERMRVEASGDVTVANTQYPSTDLMSGYDFTSGWTCVTVGGGSITGANSWTITGTAGGPIKNTNQPGFVAGGYYKFRIAGTTTGGDMSLYCGVGGAYALHSNIPVSGGAFDSTFYLRNNDVTASPGILYIRQGGNGSTTLSAFTVQRIASGALHVESNLTVGTSGGTVTIGNSAALNGGSYLQFVPSNSVRNWQIGTNFLVSGGLEISPSTALGGTTFSTSPIMFSGQASTLGYMGLGTSSPTSKLHVTGLPVYANNAAAISGGMTAGAFYRTGADPDPVCVVH